MTTLTESTDETTMITSSELRTKYLEFFEAKGSQRVSSDSLVPANDPTLLFTGAGMNQFKDQFMGKNITYSKATSCQKCIRTGDIESVGKTARHHTFFEMLGNFSFGDYFKREAITWAYEFLTEVIKVDKTRLYFSVYNDDDEAYDIWTKEVGVPEDHVTRFGEDDNFWPASSPSKGPNGPCGPCSEIFFDQGPEFGHGRADSNLSNDGDRYIEIWNLVFTQYNRKDGGVLEPLPQQNIDTGMGLERVVAVLNGAPTNFDTDLFMPTIQQMAKRASVEYGAGKNGLTDRYLRRIADHIRSLVFCMADGVMPGNEGRGYVLRRLLRRAALDARNLGVNTACIYELVPAVIEVMGGHYPDIAQREDKITTIIKAEEEKFIATLQQGLNHLEGVMGKAKDGGVKEVSGKEVFTLYDRYGFPLELSAELLEEQGLSVNLPEFEAAMDARRKESQAGSTMKGDVFAAGPMEALKGFVGKVAFTGYDSSTDEGTVIAILKDEALVDKAEAGDHVVVVTDKTPFYGESGGQIGDAGAMDADALKAAVKATHKVIDVIAHDTLIESGSLAVGDTVSLSIDTSQRSETQRNHTSTHLLQWALRNVLGTHVEQAGSLVTPERLRFDFSHFQGLTDDELRQVAHLVNEKVLSNAPVGTKVQSIEAAKAEGATALFGEKYGDEVRVVTIGDGFSKELCGGTHVGTLGEIGLIKLVSEQSVAAGVRRIEAVTGAAALAIMEAEDLALSQTAKLLKAKPATLVQSVEDLQAENKKLQKELARLKEAQALESAKSQASDMQEVNGIKFIAQQVDVVGKDLMAMLDGFKQTVNSGVVLLGGSAGPTSGKAGLACYVSKDVAAKGVKAGDIIKKLAPVINGGGGGKDFVAQAGGKDPSKLGDALGALGSVVGELSGN